MTDAAPARPPFETYYAQTLEPHLRDLDDERRDLVRQTFVEVAIAIAGVLGAIVLTANQAGAALIFLIAAVGVIIVVAWRASARMKAYREDFKARVIAKLVEYVDPHLTYSPDNFLGEDMFEECGLFNKKPDAYDGGDLVEGTLGATKIAFSEVHAQYRTTTTDGQGHARTEWHTIFKGVLFVADFNKAFHSRTFVLPDTAEKLFGSFGQKLQALNPDRHQLIKLENPDFERAFVVYGDDQVEARYLLTPALMDRILRYQQRTGEELHLSFVEGCVFVAIPSSRDLFEPRVFRSILERSLLQDYLARLELTTDIVDELNLNTRIWGKN